MYGKLAQNPEFNSHAIIDVSELDNYISKYDVIDTIELSRMSSSNITDDALDNVNGSNSLLITYNEKHNLPADSNKFRGKKNVSVSIASGITAYSRIFMSQFKNNPNFILLYTDTDSLFIIGDLDPEWIGKNLGQFKLEAEYEEIVFISPKFYGGITTDGEVVIKIKGFKNKISFEEMKSLLNKDKSLELNQEL